ncbi:Glutaredoxin [Handroanthus impetiginosus]|uniref:Glutaredoxin n=1 Tax=Handroanthus impetiginosus TaxID=429701 RepID=A0A2G9FXU2_9LAMI|nr:Glutaredoxin [Handroanthus impetiginosus]
MQNYMPNTPWPRHPPITSTNRNNLKTRRGSGLKTVFNGGISGDLKKMVKDNAVIVFAKKGCCMSHVVKRLLQALGANPAVYEVLLFLLLVQHLLEVYRQLFGEGAVGRLQFPTVFIGGRWFGGLDRVIATHISEELTPLLKQAGALWL